MASSSNSLRVIRGPQFTLIKEIYLSKCNDVKKFEKNADDSTQGRLLCVNDDPPVYGRAVVTLLNGFLTIIRIDGYYFENDRDRFDDILFQYKERNIIIVLSTKVTPFIEDIKYIKGSIIIDEKSIKVRERCESRDIKKDDIVRYESDGDTLYGRVVSVELLNNIRCVGLVDSINITGDNQVRYIREDKVTKITVDGSLTKYIDGVIIDPRSIATFYKAKSEDVNVKDDVEFKLRSDSNKYKGNIIMISVANGAPCAVVELYDNISGIDIATCQIQKLKPFKELCTSIHNNVIIVSECAIRVISKNIVTCITNNVLVLDPARIGRTLTSSIEDKIILFKNKEENIVARLKWIGCIDEDKCIGCEMTNKSLYGTNGIFGNNKLFDCTDGHGVVIPLNKIEQCCVNGSHRPLKNTFDGSGIIGSSICCMETNEQLRGKSKWKLGDRVRGKNVNGDLFGKCGWIGLVNNVEVIGVEMVQCGDGKKDELISKLESFMAISNQIRLFSSDEFIIDTVGYRFCARNNVRLVDMCAARTVTKGKSSKKWLVRLVKDGVDVLNIRWEGTVDGVECVGCMRTNRCKCGMNGVCNGQMLFACSDNVGYLIPVGYLIDTCAGTRQHLDVYKDNDGSVNLDSICCMEEMASIHRQPLLQIGSKVGLRTNSSGKERIGNCKWIGLVNGKESIGANMKMNRKDQGKRRNSWVDSFLWEKNRERIFLLDDIVHDADGEKLHFVMDRFVDVNKIWKVRKNIDNSVCNIGDYVRTRNKEYNGEVLWKGMINGERCVGIDLEEEIGCGMDGIINDKHKFKCDRGHGVITTMDNVELNSSVPKLTKDGMMDAKRYIRYEEKCDRRFLEERKISKDELVFVIIADNDGGRWKKKGKLRWCGTMNDIDVAVVELCADYHDGSNGRFWRHQLIKCADKRAIAVSWNNIHQYIPYQQMEIPMEERKFEEISVNSAVVYYKAKGNILDTLYGTVKWSGVDDEGEYLYGIELDDRHNTGTDGQFLNQRLFTCRYSFGILAPMSHVAPNVRFFQSATPAADIPESRDSQTCQYSIPIKSWRGENFGIQGNANSCYFDSSIFALFSKTDVLDFLISPLINAKEQFDVTRKFREIMAFKIVYPLRQFGTVSFHRTHEMRDVIRQFGPKFEEMKTRETDMENFSALLAKLSPDDQLLRLTTFKNLDNRIKNQVMFLQLFVTWNKRVPYISSQQMLEISMAQNEIMFDEPPTCLIMQAPRDARGNNCYEYVLPSRDMEISQLCFTAFKKCNKCAQVATWQCKKCLEKSLNIASALFCNEHKCSDNESVSIPDSSVNSRSEIQMQLKAIICIDRAHFVSYVKEDEFKNEWIFFDSMTTQNIANNYSVPKVSAENMVTKFLGKDVASMQKQINGYVPCELQRIVKDSYVFVYHNTAMTCY